VTRSDWGPLHLFVAPLSIAGSLNPASSIAVFITDPNRKPQSLATILHALFGLTAAEARLASLLAEGNSLVEIADEIRVTHGTLRSQLKSVFQKTDTSRQAQLVRLLLLLPGTLL